MGQATVKAARRQIRRAFGAEAIGTLADHHQAIVTMSAILEQTRADAAVTAHDLKMLREHYIDNERSRSYLRARLLWLFLGR